MSDETSLKFVVALMLVAVGFGLGFTLARPSVSDRICILQTVQEKPIPQFQYVCGERMYVEPAREKQK